MAFHRPIHAPKPPASASESWWIGLDREAFTVAVQERYPAIQCSRLTILCRPN